MDDISDDEISFYDEPDEMCLSPKDEKREEVTMPEIKPEFAPLDSIHVDAGLGGTQVDGTADKIGLCQSLRDRSH